MGAPELILTDATVLTLDDDEPEGDAVAILHGRVLDVGPRRRIERLAGPSTRVEHLSGSTVVPGFVDCHTHAARLGELHFRADLSRTTSKEEALSVLVERARRTPAGGWVVAWNWDESRWREREPFLPQDLDAVSREHKLLARRVCGHKAVVNAAALSAIKLPDDVPGVERERGRPTGILAEDAVDVAWEACAPALETCVKGLTIESRRLAALGITSVADTAGPRDVALLTAGARDGFMLQRSGLYLREELMAHVRALSLGTLTGGRCDLLGVKTYTDGSIGARTAALREPYADAHGTGMQLRTAKEVEGLARATSELGLQLKAHAIGDAAIDAVIDGVAAAEVPRRLRPRLEHGELLHEEHLERMARLGIIASMQPNFIGNWQGPGGLYEERLGAARTRAMNPLRSVLDAGVALAFSSDGMPYGPLYGMACAVAHPVPRERLTVEEALSAYTRGAAYALGCEGERGVLKPGALGDAVVLGEDPRRASDLARVGVRMTVIGGTVVA